MIRIGVRIFFILLVGNYLASAQENYPERIISLGPSVTEMLYLLGVEDRIVGVTTYCERPASAKKKEKVGTTMEINLEKIVSLNPDLVISTSLTNPQAEEKLKKLGIRVIKMRSPEHYYQLFDQFLELGRILGKEERAKVIIEECKRKIKDIKEKTKLFHPPRVVIQVGARPLWLAPKNSFINDFIELAGGKNVGPDGRIGICSREEVFHQDPEVIIITTMGIKGEEEKKLWEKYKTISAVKTHRIYIFDSYKLCSPTPVSLLETLKELVKIFYPDLKDESKNW
jgi:iron complex transport system substrate-binding protein